MVMYGKYAWANVSKIYIMREKKRFFLSKYSGRSYCGTSDPLVKQTNIWLNINNTNIMFS